MERASEALGITTTNFVIAPAWAEPPFYRVYLEKSQDDQGGLARRMEEEISRLNIEYASKRASQRLGPVQLECLPNGALAQWDLQCMHQHRSGEQYKHQYLFATPGEDAKLFEMGHQKIRPARLTGTRSERDTDMPFP